MALSDSWHLKSRAHLCSATEQPFAEGDPIYTALFEAADGSFERLDFSSEGWEQRQAGDEAQPFSSWQTAYKPPQTEEKPQVVEKESAEDLLKRLIEEDHESTENVRYILAIMLERQKLLRETDRQRTPNGILRVYEHRKTGDVMIIRDPDIPLDQVESVQMEVIAMLDPAEQAGEEEPATEDGQESGEQETEGEQQADGEQEPADSEEQAGEEAEPPATGEEAGEPATEPQEDRD